MIQRTASEAVKGEYRAHRTAMERLVERLEAPDLDLEEAVSLCTEFADHHRRAKEILSQVAEKVERLQAELSPPAAGAPRTGAWTT